MHMDQTSSSDTNHMNGSIEHLNGNGNSNNNGGNGVGIITGNGYDKITIKPVMNGTFVAGPLTNLSSMTISTTTSASSLTNNSFSPFHHNKSNASSIASKSPRMTPRNPVLGIGCADSDSFRGRRRSGRGITHSCCRFSFVLFVHLFI